ncbi:hypothetical protein HK104_009128 [Borealophlyctis nickersoniae]|nr:hypothetical protein HK104_009128 [Borealophlyctis nickersoniae]
MVHDDKEMITAIVEGAVQMLELQRKLEIILDSLARTANHTPSNNILYKLPSVTPNKKRKVKHFESPMLSFSTPVKSGGYRMGYVEEGDGLAPDAVVEERGGHGQSTPKSDGDNIEGESNYDNHGDNNDICLTTTCWNAVAPTTLTPSVLLDSPPPPNQHHEKLVAELKKYNLEQYANTFTRERLTVETLARLPKDELQMLIPCAGDRVRVRDLVRDLAPAQRVPFWRRWLSM